MLPRAFYQIPGTELAPKLIGKLLCCESPEGLVTGRIVEVEAYMGPLDKGAHSYGGRRTGRTEIQFGEGGYAYIYLIYGMKNIDSILPDVRQAVVNSIPDADPDDLSGL